jgi:predicted DCC family thiol-disulfide oxidoreductase YuxK
MVVMGFRGVSVLVYDGDCSFCAACARRIEGWADGSIRVVPWQQADLAALHLTADRCAAAVQFVAPDGTHAGGRAVAGALRECRQPWRAVGHVLDWGPLRPPVEWAYVQVASRRHRLPGGTAACRLDLDRDERPLGGVAGQGVGHAVTPTGR